MEPQELAENTEKAKESGERAIGLTMAILAILLAASTLLSHRAHTEEVLLETRATDQWNYFQAKNIRSHVYDADAEIAGPSGGKLRPECLAVVLDQQNGAPLAEVADSIQIPGKTERVGDEQRLDADRPDDLALSNSLLRRSC